MFSTGRSGLGSEHHNQHLRDEYEQKCDAIDADQQASSCVQYSYPIVAA